LEDLADVRQRYLFVEQVAHGIHEYHTRATPAKWLLCPLRSQCEIKACFEGMSANTAEALRKALGVTVVATAAHLCASGYRIPGCVGPLDCAVLCHFPTSCNDAANIEILDPFLRYLFVSAT